MPNLSETHRPTALSDVVGQSRACSMLQSRIDAGTLGNSHYWISGKSGTGKTTIARIIAGHLGHSCEGVEVVGRSIKASDVQQWASDDRTRSMWGEKKVIIINESHGMSKPVIEHLLDFLESARNSVVIFTTTLEGQAFFDDAHMDAGPLLSRCIPVRLESQGLAAAFAEHVAEKAAVDKGKVARYIKDNGPNMRSLWNAVESGQFS